jgi:hypothetical protein
MPVITYFRVRKSVLPRILPVQFREVLSPPEPLETERRIARAHSRAIAKFYLLTAHAYFASRPVHVLPIFHKARHALHLSSEMRGHCSACGGSTDDWQEDYRLLWDSFERNRLPKAWWWYLKRGSRGVALRKGDGLKASFTADLKELIDWLIPIVFCTKFNLSIWTTPGITNERTYDHIRPDKIDKLVNLKILSPERHRWGRIPSK